MDKFSELNYKVVSASSFDQNLKVKFKQMDEGVFVYTEGVPANEVDMIIKLVIK